MSGSEAGANIARRERLTFGTIVVVGGGCYGSYYVRQLRRAASAGAASWQRLVVVDRDPACALVRTGEVPPAGESGDGIQQVVSDWRAFFDEYLGAAANEPSVAAHDAIVPSPLMPHLMFDWIIGRARERWPDREIAARPLKTSPSTPWQRPTPDGPHYVSFAEWMCPINCIEPRICPHTRSLRDWSLPETARQYVEAEASKGETLVGPVIFHCTHRTYGVGMFDTSAVLAGDEMVRAAGARQAVEVLVGTMSHCHGAFQRLVIGAPVARGSIAPGHE